MSIDSKLVVRGLVNAYFDEGINYALQLGEVYQLTNEQIKEILKMAISNKLSQLSKTWKKVTPIAASFSNVPDNDYTGDLKEMKIEESKKSQRLQVVSTIEVVEGDYQGKTVKKFDGLDNEQSLGYFKNYCEVIGLDLPEDAELWQEAMDEFIANNQDLYNVTVKTNGQYQNVYINGLSELTKGGESTEETVEEVAAEEEATEEVAEEEVVEEVEEQEVVAPKKMVAVKQVAKTIAKPVAKPVIKQIAKPAIPKKIVAKR